MRRKMEETTTSLRHGEEEAEVEVRRADWGEAEEEPDL